MTHIRFQFGFSLLVFSIFCFGAAQPAAAQKLAYLDASKLLKRMPEAKDAESKMNQLIAAWTKEATEMQAEIDRKQTDFDRRKLIMTDAERSSSQLELDNLRKKLDTYRHQKFDVDGGELFAQQETMMKPAYEKLSNAIKEIAGDLGYDYVIDRSSHDVVLLYSNSKYDITIPVARKLGIENEVLSTPLVSQTPKPVQPNQSGVPGQTVQPGQPGLNGVQQQPIPGQPQPNQPVPQQPGFNTGGYNPGQIPPPVNKH
jgi:outer membrane protein